MSSGCIIFERFDDGVARITINRPERLNALNAEVMKALDETFLAAAADAQVKGLIFTGAGEKAFAAGADIKEFTFRTPLEAEASSRRGHRILGMLETMGKPSIAAINGYALGGGLELALACTLRVASTHAKLGLPEVKLGLIPGYGGTERLPVLVGKGRALELLLTGEPVDAQEAWRIGLVNHVVAPEGLLEFCHGLMRRMVANAPRALALAMQAVERGPGHESELFGLAASTQDMHEGVQAFLEKRPPQFQGR